MNCEGKIYWTSNFKMPFHCVLVIGRLLLRNVVSQRGTLVNGVLLHDSKQHGEPGSENYQQKTYLFKPELKVARPDPLSTRLISRSTMVDETLDHRRSTAISQSLFSTILSLLVGMVIWEAKNPCLPLVLALFSVVGISLKSVVQFFSTIEARPASDAVALLSSNCFILGTITFPTLPTIAHMIHFFLKE